MRYVVEPMRVEDIDEVIEVEREAFTTAWSAASYRRDLTENRMAHYLVLRKLSEDVDEPPGETPPVADSAAPSGSSKSGLQRLTDGLRRMVSGPPEAPAVKRGRIVGYTGMWLIVDEAHLTSIAVRQECRGGGLGELLLVESLALARQLGARAMTLEVRVSNAVAQSLYRKYGFQIAGVRRRYYTDNNEDALIMTAEDISSFEFGARFEELRADNARRTGVGAPNGL